MDLYLIDKYLHHKNLHFLQKCKKINVKYININELNDNMSNGLIYSAAIPINTSQYPKLKFLFGPQFSVLPDNRLLLIKRKDIYYNLLSEWIVNIWKKYSICNDLNLVTLPFGVDSEKFCEIKSINNRDKVIVYYKRRNPNELNYILNFLKKNNIEYILFFFKKI
jgi:hypothetical protein